MEWNMRAKSGGEVYRGWVGGGWGGGGGVDELWGWIVWSGIQYVRLEVGSVKIGTFCFGAGVKGGRK